MLIIIGTVPDESFPLVESEASLSENRVIVGDHTIEINRGTPALIAAAIKTLDHLNLESPRVMLVGDTGVGNGSRKLYRYLVERIPDLNCQVICFHYLQPDVDWHYHILTALESLSRKPRLIADAGFMYAAKMADAGPKYDLFTPDVGELAFLADEEAPHPFYTRGFILHDDNLVPELIDRAYQYGNAAKTLLVKGSTDYIVENGRIVEKVDEPVTEALEAMGGTGDTVTGIVSALIYAGFPIKEAAVFATKVNRVAGFKACPTPASQVRDIISQIPDSLSETRVPIHFAE